MENFEGKHRAFDPVSHRDSQIETRLSEVKTKILRSAERKLLSHLYFTVANVRINDSKISSLNIKEDEESGVAVYDGKVEISATYLQKNQIKKADFIVTIAEGQPAIVAEDVQKALENASDIAAVVEETPSGTSTVKASLKEFKLVDDGSRYFKVYHTAAYGDLEPIGAVAKNEYETCTAKAELLKTMFQDEALSWPASVEFADEFTEPTITASVAEAPVYKVKADPKLEKINVAAGYVEEGRYKSADTFRFQVEAAEKNFNDLKRRIEQRAIIALTDSFKSNRMGHFKVKKAETSFDSENKTGKVIIHTELLDGKDTKVVPFEVQVSNESMTLPTKEQVVSLLKDTKVVESVEIPAAIEAVAKTTELSKEASPNAPPMFGYQEVLRIPKDFLPASLKVGSVVEVDGARYRLVSKSEGQLDKGRDSAPHWMFERVHEAPTNKNQPVYRVDY